MQGSESSSPRSGPQQPPPPPQDTSSSRSTCYLDYAGAGLASPAQLRAVFDSLIPGGKEGSVPVLAAVNPHSSRAAEEEVRRARYIVLSFIGADPGQYEVIFTSGATAAVKLVGEALGASSYRGDTSCCLLYAKNSHTSVVGLRGLFPRGAYCIDGHITSPDCKLVDVTEKHHRSVPSHEEGDPELALIATPGECNFSGAKIDLAATARSVPGVCDRLLPYAARATRCLWLLDIAKLASTSRIDISAQIPEPSLRPHFMCLSFYKIFGYPTGLGALVVRRDAAPLLQRRYWGGGTVDAAAADSAFCVLRGSSALAQQRAGAAGQLLSLPHDGGQSVSSSRLPLLSAVDDSLAQRFEDGTPHFLGIQALRFGFDAIAAFGGMTAVQDHTFRLARRILEGLGALRHINNKASQCNRRSARLSMGREWSGEVCEIYGWGVADSDHQGSIVSFNVIDASGHYVPFSDVGRQALQSAGIVLRTGCFCNVGACQTHLLIPAADVEANFATGRRCGGADGVGDVINGRPTGAVRASVGYLSTDADVATLVNFINNEYVVKGFQDAEAASECLLQIPHPVAPVSESVAAPELEELSEGDHYVLKRMYIYPIKSCAGIRVAKWPLSDNGLFLDREWAIVDALSGRALTQKSHPRMSLIETRVDLDSGELVVSTASKSSELRLAIYSHACIVSSSAGGMGGARELLVSSDVVMVCQQPRVVGGGAAADVYAEADEWFSAFLGTSCRLQRRAPPAERDADLDMTSATTITSGEAVSNFVNEAQFLMITEASLGLIAKLVYSASHAGKDSISATEDEEVVDTSPSQYLSYSDADVARFRPNLVLGRSDSPVAAPSDTFAEDDWAEVSLCAASPLSSSSSPSASSIAKFRVTGPCARCSMINVDQSRGVMDGRFLQTLGAYRRLARESSDSGDGGPGRVSKGISFGQFLCMQPHLQSAAEAAAPSLYRTAASSRPEDSHQSSSPPLEAPPGAWFNALLSRACADAPLSLFSLVLEEGGRCEHEDIDVAR